MKIKIYILVIGITLLQSSLVFSDDWQISITGVDANGIGASHTIYLGTCSNCTDNWEFGEDEYDYPNPFSGEYTNIHFPHLGWYGQEDENGNVCDQIKFSTDYRAIHQNSDLISWGIGGNVGGGLSLDIPINISWEASSLDSLSADYELYIHIGNTGYNMRETTSINVDQSYFYLDENFEPDVQVLMGACAATGTTPYYIDNDNDGWGSNVSEEFCLGYEPDGWVINNADLNDELFCESNLIDDCNICDGENQAKDCNGDCFGESIIDDCGICSGGYSGHISNSDQDCNGDCFGESIIDDCGICSGGSSGHISNSDQDCNGDCFGESIIDDCGDCVNSGFNQNCLDDILGEGPENVFAQMHKNNVSITWSIPDVSMYSFIVGYNIYSSDSDSTEYLGNTDSTTFIVTTILEGIFCVSAFDQFENESDLTCVEAVEMCMFDMELHDGPNLISFPCIPDDNSVTNIGNIVGTDLAGIIGGGSAAIYVDNLGWVGALQNINYLSGYWFLIESQGSNDIQFSLTGTPPPNDLTYEFSSEVGGIYIISYQGDNLILIEDALPDAVEPFITHIIGEGIAAINNPVLGWIGSLTYFELGYGYWINTTQAFSFRWENRPGRQNIHPDIAKTPIPKGYEFDQSTAQAFYFIENIELQHSSSFNDGWILSYHNGIVTGIRQWQDKIVDIPVMGNDGHEYSVEYLKAGEKPEFKYLDNYTGELIHLHYDNIPTWENNSIFMLGTLKEKKLIPSEISLNAYPNPFNPSTTLSFSVPVEGIMQVSIYNISGQEIAELANEFTAPGTYKYAWDANAYPSGVYLARLNLNNTFYTKKLVLMK